MHPLIELGEHRGAVNYKLRRNARIGLPRFEIGYLLDIDIKII
jgi:hypothetical protein